jgi:histidinol dehydrogenase
MLEFEILEWDRFIKSEKELLLMRPVQSDGNMHSQVRDILNDVRIRKDAAVQNYTLRYDHVGLERFIVSPQEIADAKKLVSQKNIAAMQFAIDSVVNFHIQQVRDHQTIETNPGVYCQRQLRPIARVGLYVPGGQAPLPSTVWMLAVPARLAGCPLRIICTPPRHDGTVDPHILVAADLCGVQQIFKIGGAQAIAAMAYGTETIPKVDKIFGPGNAWVTQAKLFVMQDSMGAACDLPAGPSELLVIADDKANAKFVAADLLSQGEHAEDAQVLLVTNTRRFAELVIEELKQQLELLSRKRILEVSLQHARIIVVNDIGQAFEISNHYAPEHLSLQIENVDEYLNLVQHAGTVFIGKWTAETLGDYVTGSNHVLPTCGFSRAYSGLSLLDFMKFISFQRVTADGLKNVGQYAETLAEIEQLDAHKNAVSVRMRALQ